MKKLTKNHLIYGIGILVSVAILAAFTALIAVPSVKRAAVKIAKNNLYETQYSFPEGAVITAKNGLANNEKNSLIYVRAALQKDVDCFEIDLCFDEKGKPFVAENADKITDNSMPFEYLISFISEEINASAQQKHFINIHLEDASEIGEVTEIITRYEMDDFCFFTGVNVNQASYIRQNSSIPFYLDYEIDKSKADDPDYAISVVNAISNSGAMGINCSADNFSNTLASMIKESWLKISFYDVETELEIIDALKFSPNQIITRDPQLVRSILTEWNAKAPSSDLAY